jgi:CTD small phosphatase-like protein 2
VKDLSKLGRNLQKTIIIDNVSQNFSLEEENGLQIISFLGDENDSILLELSSYLKSNLFLILDIVIEKVKDVRYALTDLRDILNL